MLTPNNLQLRSNDRLLQITFAPLPTGSYQLVINAPAVTDRAGNPLGTTNTVDQFSLLPASIAWSNPLGGDWSNPNNWDLGRLPNLTDDVLISVPNNATISFSQGNTTVSSLLSENPFTLSGGTLTVLNTIQVNNDFTLNGGKLIGATILRGKLGQGMHLSGSLQFQGVTSLADIDWGSGSIGGSLTSYGAFLISGTGNTTSLTGGTLTNAGTVVRSGANDWYLENGAVVNNLAGAVFETQANGRIYFTGGTAVAFNNAGTLHKSAGTGTLEFNGVPLNNSGIVQVDSGTLSLAAGGTSTGTFNVSSGAGLAFSNGTYVLQAGTSLSGAGFSHVNGGTVTVADAVSVANFAQDGGRLGGAGNLTVTGVFDWTGGTQGGSGATVLAAGSQGTIRGSGHVFDGRLLDNTAAAVDWTSGTIRNMGGAITPLGKFVCLLRQERI